MPQTSTPHERLKEMFDKHSRLRIPRDSQDADVTLAHAQLIRYDSHVAGVVTRVLGGHEVEPGWLQSNQELDAFIENLLASKPAAERQRLEDYHRYKQHLDGLLGLAAEALRERR